MRARLQNLQKDPANTEMIRFLQKDNRFTKAAFAVIIGGATISMVLYLVPGLYEGVTGPPAGVFATVRQPGLLGRLGLGDSTEIKTTQVQRVAQNMAQRQGLPPQYMQFFMPRFEAQAAQVLIANAIEEREADRLGIRADENDVKQELQQGEIGQLLFPNGQFIGIDKYTQFVQANGYATTADFEDKIRQEITAQRLVEFTTAGATVSDEAVREQIRKQDRKVKFDYAVVSAEDVAKTINPIDSDLEKFFNANKQRYAHAVPEKREIKYIALTDTDLPAKPEVTQAELQAYYNAHQADFHVDQQVKVRHILISAPQGSDAKADAAAKAKAEDILNKLHNGADFATLAKQYSDDPGSKAQGGELGYVKANGQMVKPFQDAAMALKPGQISGLVKTSFGYHIIQAEARDEAHQKPLSEVADQIRPILEKQKEAASMRSFASQVAADAKNQGMDKAAAAHHLQVVTTPEISADGTISGLPEGEQLLQAAFAAKPDAAPSVAPAGPGTLAVFQPVNVQPAHAPTFAEWKSHVLDDYRQEQVPQLMQAKVTRLADLAHQMNDLHKAAAQLNVPVQTSDLVDQSANIPGLGQMSGPASVAFDLKQGGISGPVATGNAGAVLQVTEMQEPGPDVVAKDFATRRAQLVEQKRAEMFGVYIGTLMDEYQKQGAIRVVEKPKPGTPLGI